MKKQLRYIGATIVLVVLAALFYIAIINYGNNYVNSGIPYSSDNSFMIETICEDKIVCYSSNSYSNFCFRDEDLVEKYCWGD